MGDVPLPELPGEPLDGARDSVVELEARVPAQRPVPEYPQRVVVGPPSALHCDHRSSQIGFREFQS